MDTNSDCAQKGGQRYSMVLLAHGAGNFLRDRLLFNSDFYRIHVCDICGMIAQSDLDTQMYLCKCKRNYNRTKVSQVFLPYAIFIGRRCLFHRKVSIVRY